MSKIVAYSALLYGKDYLESAIRSVIDYVDLYYVIYSHEGSHGHWTERPCPESETTLHHIAERAAGDKLRWFGGRFAHEGIQRETIHQLAPDADLIFVLDADEIWTPENVQKMLDTGAAGTERNILCRGVHFWRSFYRAVTNDYASPTRVINPHVAGGSRAVDAYFAHMGYAQNSAIVEYKQHVHGHKAEWRQGWFENKFAPNAQDDVHPTNVNFWNPVAVNPFDYMPSWMVEHPYANLEVIP
jgi:hypothetical protein